MTRYARQIVLPEVGPEGQARLGRAHVLVVGAGGLGVPVLQYLAGAGVGRITVVDPDRVDEANLHRQTLYSHTQIGKPKAEAAADVLRGLNADCEIVPAVAALDPGNAGDLLADVTLALDCADSFAASYVLSDACHARSLPLVSASALGLSGYVGGFCGGGPSLRAVFPDLPDQLANCATAGVLGPVVGTLGSMQAQMALSIMLDLAPSPLGQLVTFHAAAFRFGSFRFDGTPEPDSRIWRFLPASEITASDFVAELRELDEAPVPVTATAHRLRVEDFGRPDGPVPRRGQRAVLCCRTGLRSWRAANRLQGMWDGEILLVALGDH